MKESESETLSTLEQESDIAFAIRQAEVIIELNAEDEREAFSARDSYFEDLMLEWALQERMLDFGL